MSDALAVVVGVELRRMRMRAGLTQLDIARALKLPRPVVSRRERGVHTMQIAHIDEHARACGGSLALVLLRVDIASGALPPGAGVP